MATQTTTQVSLLIEREELCNLFSFQNTTTYDDNGFTHTFFPYQNGLSIFRISSGDDAFTPKVYASIGSAPIPSVTPALLENDAKYIVEFIKIPAINLNDNFDYYKGDVVFNYDNQEIWFVLEDGYAQSLVYTAVAIGQFSDESFWNSFVLQFFDAIPTHGKTRSGFFNVCCVEKNFLKQLTTYKNDILSGKLESFKESKCNCEYPEILRASTYYSILKGKDFAFDESNELELTKIFNSFKAQNCCKCKACKKKGSTQKLVQESIDSLERDNSNICVLNLPQTCTYTIPVPCCNYVVENIDSASAGQVEFTVPSLLSNGLDSTTISISFLFRYIGGSGFSLNFTETGGSFTRAQILQFIRDNFNDLEGRLSLGIDDSTGKVVITPLVPSTVSPNSPSTITIQSNLFGYPGTNFCADFNIQVLGTVNSVLNCTNQNTSISFWFSQQLPFVYQYYQNEEWISVPYEDVLFGDWTIQSCEELTIWRALNRLTLELESEGSFVASCPTLLVRKEEEEFVDVTENVSDGEYTLQDSEGGTLYWRLITPFNNDAGFIITNGEVDPTCVQNSITGTPCELIQILQNQINELQNNSSGLTCQTLEACEVIQSIIERLVELEESVSPNIYNSDGVVTSDRNVDMDDNSLSFTNGKFLSFNFEATLNSYSNAILKLVGNNTGNGIGVFIGNSWVNLFASTGVYMNAGGANYVNGFDIVGSGTSVGGGITGKSLGTGTGLYLSGETQNSNSQFPGVRLRGRNTGGTFDDVIIDPVFGKMSILNIPDGIPETLYARSSSGRLVKFNPMILEYYGEASYTGSLIETELQSFLITPDKWKTNGIYYLYMLGRLLAGGTVTALIRLRHNTVNSIAGSTILRTITIVSNNTYSADGGYAWGQGFHLFKQGNNIRYDAGSQTAAVQPEAYSDLGQSAVTRTKIVKTHTINPAVDNYIIVTVELTNAANTAFLSNLYLKQE